MSAKKFFRWFATSLLGYMLLIAMFLIANAFVFSQVTSNPEKMKDIINSSEIYQKLPETVLETVNKNNAQVESKNDYLSLDNPEVKAAALAIFTPQFFQTNTEKAIDGTYGWLNGKTVQPEYKIDIAHEKKQFIDKITKLQIERIEALPACSFSQLRDNMDASNLECRPPITLSSEALKQQINKQASSSNLLEKTTFTPEDLKDEHGQSLYKKFPDAPAKFQAGKYFWILLVVAVVILSGLIILVSDSRGRALLGISRIFIVTGIFIAFAPYGIKFFSDKILIPNSNDPIIVNVLAPLISEFNSATASIYYATGALVIILGIVGLLVYSGRIKLPKKARQNK